MSPQALAVLAARDARLALAIDVLGPYEHRAQRGSPYEALLSAIAHQQLHGKAAATILSRLRALYPGERYPTPAELLATPDAALRGAGLSRAKLLAMKDVAARTLDGTVPDRRRLARLADAAIIERLVAVRGVGRWTAEMLLMFTLGRPDVLPVGDFGIRHGFQLLSANRSEPTPKALAVYGERWAPYRTTASWYLWRWVDHVRGQRTAAALAAAAPSPVRRRAAKA